MRQVITASDVPARGEWHVPKDAVWTPSARDLARERGVKVVETAEGDLPKAPADRTICIGSDHGGFRMKEFLKPVIESLHLTVHDAGVYEEKRADYPDIAEKVAGCVASGKVGRGIIVDGAGIGSAMVANKIPGIRAALCYDKASARNSREHNNANVLTLGGRLLTESQAEEVVRTWLETPFAGGRHQARVDKIAAVERKHLKKNPEEQV
ncbi:MAG: ribose 5-phosphate isomerase B [Bryobacteraceae bacterium]